MNELEKALEQLNIKYETNGKQYKIPTTKENLVELLKGYIAMTINLQSKIDKAIEVLNQHMPTYASCVKALDEIEFILKEDK